MLLWKHYQRCQVPQPGPLHHSLCRDGLSLLGCSLRHMYENSFQNAPCSFRWVQPSEKALKWEPCSMPAT